MTLPLLLVFVTLHLMATAQINPGADDIYNPDVVARIEVNMTTEDKEFLLDDKNVANRDYLPVDVRFVNAKIDETVSGAGIRLRGNTSRGHPKRSFKIKFTEFEGGEKFHGYKKFNLKAENNDPSLLREHLSLQLYREANVPAARSHHVEVYINGEYMGLYLNVEQIDDEFADTRYGSEKGNLYKCSWGASLEMSNDVYDNELFKLETNKDVNDRSILENFIETLNTSSGSQFKSEIEAILNVENAIRFLAVEALIGHWDGYSYNQNNFYILENPDNDKIELIPYDLDNTFGINWIPNDWATHDLMNWANELEERPLHNRLLAVDEFRELYVKTLWDLMAGVFTEASLFPEMDRLQDMLSEFVKNDTYYPKTFGFDHDDFLNSLDKEVVRHCPYGLKPYVTTRIGAAKEQLPVINSVNGLVIADFKIYPNPSPGDFIFLEGISDSDIPHIEVFSSSGKRIPAIIYLNGRVEFAVLPNPGMYVLTSPRGSARFVVN